MPRERKPPKQFPDDTSGNLFNHIKAKYGFKTDVEIARKVGMWTNDVSRIRNGKRELTNSNKLKIHIATKMSIKQIERLIAKEEA